VVLDHIDLDHWGHLVRHMRLVLDLVEIELDELPFVRLRIEIGVYVVRGIPSASVISIEAGCGKGERQTFPPK